MRKPRDVAVRDRLVQAAVTLFATRGYAATSTREIVAAAGVTKPTLYYYFESKEGIFRAILEYVERLSAEALQVVDGSTGSVRERIERIFLAMYDRFEREKTVLRFMNSVLWGPPQETPRCDLTPFYEQLAGALQRLVEEGITSAELRPARPADMVRVLIGILSHSFDLALVFPRRAPGKAGLKRDLGLVLRGLAGPGAAEDAP
jgi:AcrR family transcriptional regulator